MEIEFVIWGWEEVGRERRRRWGSVLSERMVCEDGEVKRMCG